MIEQSSLTVKQLCQTIELIYSTIDDYPYVYDFINDYYYISPNAANRFAMRSHSFHNVVDNLRAFVYPDDFEALQKDLDEVLSGIKDSHNM